MENKFREFHKFTDDEFKKLWEEAIFVFDTNILLDLYRYRKESSDKYLKLLKLIKAEDRVWIPHQVGLEFHKERVIVISDLKKSYTDIKDILEDSIKIAKKKIDNKYHEEHPLLDLKEINLELDGCLKKLVGIINRNEKSHPDWFSKDTILEELNNIFKGSIGDEYPEDKLKKIYSEGKERYDKEVPPGYEDANHKDDDRKYGDLVLWYQIIDHAKKSRKSIIFVTRDKKEDWWWKSAGNTLGPRYELRKELLTEAKVDFHMYDSKRFFEYASEHYKQPLDEETLDEVKRIGALDERKSVLNKTWHLGSNSSLFKELIVLQYELEVDFARFSERLGLDERIIFENNHLLGRIRYHLENFSNGDLSPRMIEKLLILGGRIKRNLREVLEIKELDASQRMEFTRFLERLEEMRILLMRYADRCRLSKKSIHVIGINNPRIKDYFRDSDI